eukprot:gene5342-2279_t
MSAMMMWSATAPLEKIVPLGFGGSTDGRASAFYGDKVLGAALALTPQRLALQQLAT